MLTGSEGRRKFRRTLTIRVRELALQRAPQSAWPDSYLQSTASVAECVIPCFLTPSTTTNMYTCIEYMYIHACIYMYTNIMLEEDETAEMSL